MSNVCHANLQAETVKNRIESACRELKNISKKVAENMIPMIGFKLTEHSEVLTVPCYDKTEILLKVELTSIFRPRAQSSQNRLAFHCCI